MILKGGGDMNFDIIYRCTNRPLGTNTNVNSWKTHHVFAILEVSMHEEGELDTGEQVRVLTRAPETNPGQIMKGTVLPDKLTFS